MLYRMILATSFVAMIMAGAPAHACITSVPVELVYIEDADLVVVGRIDNYKIIRDPVARQKFADSNDLSPDRRKSLERESFMSDYSRFDVVVDEVLFGKAPQTLTVIWDNSTFSLPETMPSGPFLIALRGPFRSSGTISASPESNFLTVLQAPCSAPFMFSTESAEADAIRKRLHR